MPRLSFTVNGRRREVEAPAGATLVEILRHKLGLTGAKLGCGEGVCGACTVLVEGQARKACVTPAAAVAGRRVTTIEGLARGDKLHAVQQAFLEKEAFQCGYCTPGMIMAAAGLLGRNPAPGRGEIKAALEGNVCRCGAYPRIVEAVRLAAEVARRG